MSYVHKCPDLLQRIICYARRIKLQIKIWKDSLSDNKGVQIHLCKSSLSQKCICIKNVSKFQISKSYSNEKKVKKVFKKTKQLHCKKWIMKYVLLGKER